MSSLVERLLPSRSAIAYGAGTVSLTFGAGFWQTSLVATAALTIVAGVAAVLGWNWNEDERARVHDLESRLLKESSDANQLRSACERGQVQCDDALMSLLESVNSSIGLGSTCRTSLYQRSELGWLRKSRFSLHVTHGAGGRELLPLGDAIVDRAYVHGEFSIEMSDFAASAVSYLDEQKALGLNKTVARSLRMKSQVYWAISFGLPGARGRDCVLVVESTDPFAFKDDHPSTVYVESVLRVVREMVEVRSAISTS